MALLDSLVDFRTLPAEQVRAAVSQIAPRRGECVRLIGALEAALQMPGPFYEARPADSAANVEAFLANLPQLFALEWTAANPGEESKPKQA